MKPLRIVVLTDDAERFRGALTIAAAHAALGGDAALFLQLDAVRLLRAPYTAPMDITHSAAGLPTMAQLVEDALSLGVRLMVCQSGLALAGLDLVSCDARIEASGPVAFVQALGDDDRLIFA